MSMEKTKQPPSGGCVLKPRHADMLDDLRAAAAFGRLCVETRSGHSKLKKRGRLCVETQPPHSTQSQQEQPPSGGCVLKPVLEMGKARVKVQPPSGGCVLKLVLMCCNRQSHQAAAFGRLCVETLY